MLPDFRLSIIRNDVKKIKIACSIMKCCLKTNLRSNETLMNLLSDMDQSILIEDTISRLNSILSSAEKQFADDPDGFLARDGISSFGKYISIVADLCHSLKLCNYDELKEHLQKTTFSDLRIRWNDFLSKVDHQSVLSSTYPASLPLDVQLLDVDSNTMIDLADVYQNDDRTLFVFLRHLA